MNAVVTIFPLISVILTLILDGSFIRDVRIGFNLYTAAMLIFIVLTLFTELLYFEYFRNGVGYVVVTCYLGWAMTS